ncbi:MAG: homocysteine S-methyltransferase family protein [Coriobacteriales bacterium]|jgi:5-methyltetrahydrofolate--homocysteine methyltransferase
MAGRIEELLGGKVGIAEGAMGTMLLSGSSSMGDDLMALNVEKPERIGGIHWLYRGAGATCAISNSFSPCTSDDPVVQAERAKIVTASVRIAREANPDALVLGDMGPSSLMLEPLGAEPFDKVLGIYKRHIEALLAGGPDAILLETFIEVADLRCAIIAAREVCELPIIASCSFNESLVMPLSSTPPEVAAIIAESLGADMVGVNCGFGPDKMLEVVERMSAATSLPLIVQPNAGLPQVLESGETVYPGTPAEMASYASRYVELGAAIVGSCCGSTPAFTQAICDAVGGVALQPRGDVDSTLVACSMSASEAVDPDGFDPDDCECLDVADALFDPEDALELVGDLPVAVIDGSGNDFAEHLDDLVRTLRLYPGRAVVQVGNKEGLAASMAKDHGAIIL